MFDPKHIDEREFISSQNITPKELREDNVQRRIDAYFSPQAPSIAIRFFNFITKNDNCVLLAGGMSHSVMGLDRDKLNNIAKLYNIDLGRYLFAVDYYENKMLEKNERERKARG